jgi:predicted alpha/beta-hydrolase family hydrolase
VRIEDGYSRRRAKAEVALRDSFSSASVLGWQSSCLRPHGMARGPAVPMMLDSCEAVTSTGGTVSRRMLRDMCQRRHTASHPSFQNQSRSRDGRSGPGGVCAGGVKGRVGGKAFDLVAGELKA